MPTRAKERAERLFSEAQIKAIGRTFEERSPLERVLEAEPEEVERSMLEEMTERSSRLSLALSDVLDRALAIEKSFSQSMQTGLEGSMGGQQDRARHILWMQNLAEKYGPATAFVLGGIHEGTGIVNPIRIVIRDMVLGDVPPKVVEERVIESIKEIPRDIRTNLWAVNNIPTDEDGNLRPLTPKQVAQVAGRLKTYPTPEENRFIADVPELAPPEIPKPSEPVYEEALPEGLKTTPGDSGKFEFDVPLGAPDPKGGSGLNLLSEYGRKHAFREDI